MPKMSSFIIGLIIISMITAGIAITMADFNKHYGTPDTYDNDTINAYNKLDEISNLSIDIKDQTIGIKEKTGVLDIVGSVFSSGFQVLLLTKQSFNIFQSILSTALTTSVLGDYTGVLVKGITAIVLVIIFVGIIISAIIKKDV